MINPKEQIWPYLHNELSAEESQQFEQVLKNSPSLQNALEECREIHRNMELLGDRLLEEHLLAEWESEHPEFQEKQPRLQTKIIRFAIPLAAAAAVILLLSLPLHQSPVNWQRTVYGSPPQLRGLAGNKQHYTSTDLKEINRALQDAIESSIQQISIEPWKLQIHLQELASGYLAVEVSGHAKSVPDKSKTWEAIFQDMEHFNAEAPAFAELIANDMAN